MSETTSGEAAPAVESEAPEPVVEVSSQPEQTSTEGKESAPAPSSEPAATQPTTQADWRDKRIATLTRRLRELQQAPAQQPPQAAQPNSDQALIEQRARELAVVQEFNRRCDETALAGRAQFGEAEFNARIANLQKLSDPTDTASVQAYNSMLMAALEAGDADRLLYELGADLNEAQRILGLNPTKMAVELTRRAAKAPTQVSAAAKPITPIGTRTASHEPIEPDNPDRADHLSTQEWMRRREAQLADRRRAN